VSKILLVEDTSQDLRDYVVRAVERGASARKAAHVQVSRQPLIKLIQLRQTCSAAPARFGGPRCPTLGSAGRVGMAHCQGGHVSGEIRAKLARQRLTAGAALIHRWLRTAGYEPEPATRRKAEC
jgi:hypothetical protein